MWKGGSSWLYPSAYKQLNTCAKTDCLRWLLFYFFNVCGLRRDSAQCVATICRLSAGIVAQLFSSDPPPPPRSCLPHLSVLCFHFKGQPGNPGVGSGQLVHLGNAAFKILSLTLAVRSVKMLRTLFECIYFVAPLAPLMVTIRERGKFSKRGQ